MLINWGSPCLYFACCLLYSYHSSIVVGMLIRLILFKECWLGTQSLGLGWTLSKVGTRVGSEEDLLQSSPPHKSGMPSWSGDREHYTTLHVVASLVPGIISRGNCILHCIKEISTEFISVHKWRILH